MISRSAATVERGGLVRRLISQAPLTLRQVRSEQPQVAALCLVGAAAGPLAGDTLGLELELRPGAAAQLVATGASIAQGRGRAAPAVLRTRVSLAVQTSLVATPPTLVVCAGSRVQVHLDLELDAAASVIWREMVVMGRTAEPPGAAQLHWRVQRAGRPLLHQSVDLSDPVLRAWPGMLRGGRVMGCALISGEEVSARTIVVSETAAAQMLDPRSALITVLAGGAVEATRQLDGLCRDILFGSRV